VRDRIYAYLVEFIVEPDDDRFYVHCPGLGGVHESGRTVEEALANAYDAFLTIVEARLERGDMVPEGPQLLALRTPPELPLDAIKPGKMSQKERGRVQVKTLLVPIPA
jgi:predicted RNase H-like HicB family nuclease